MSTFHSSLLIEGRALSYSCSCLDANDAAGGFDITPPARVTASTVYTYLRWMPACLLEWQFPDEEGLHTFNRGEPHSSKILGEGPSGWDGLHGNLSWARPNIHRLLPSCTCLPTTQARSSPRHDGHAGPASQCLPPRGQKHLPGRHCRSLFVCCSSI